MFNFQCCCAPSERFPVSINLCCLLVRSSWLSACLDQNYSVNCNNWCQKWDPLPNQNSVLGWGELRVVHHSVLGWEELSGVHYSVLECGEVSGRVHPSVLGRGDWSGVHPLVLEWGEWRGASFAPRMGQVKGVHHSVLGRGEWRGVHPLVLGWGYWSGLHPLHSPLS